jgi:hypothetical protein
MVAVLGCWAQSAPAQENFSAKPAPQLFATDCTGSGCHRSPHGLAKGQSQGSLAGFLREHYTNSRESAAALATYLLGARGAPPSEARTRPQPAARPSRATEQAEEPPARSQRGRQTAATPAPPPPPPPAPPEPEPAAAPAEAPAPAKPKFDIFD